MQGPEFGALGATFTVARLMQAISLISIIGMTANFVSQMVSSSQVPPPVLVGTLAVTCVSALYVIISYILYLDSLLPLLISCAIDSALLIAIMIVAITVGKPLSYLNCAGLPSLSAADTGSFLDSVGSNLYKVNYWVWAGASKTTCYEMKSIWGLSIALSILFAFSSVVSICIWKSLKVAGQKKKADEAGAAKEADLERGGDEFAQ